MDGAHQPLSGLDFGRRRPAELTPAMHAEGGASPPSRVQWPGTPPPQDPRRGSETTNPTFNGVVQELLRVRFYVSLVLKFFFLFYLFYGFDPS